MLYSAKCHEEGVRIYLGFHSDTPPPLIGRRHAEQKIQLCCALQVLSLRTDPMCSSNNSSRQWYTFSIVSTVCCFIRQSKSKRWRLVMSGKARSSKGGRKKLNNARSFAVLFVRWQVLIGPCGSKADVQQTWFSARSCACPRHKISATEKDVIRI